MSDLVEPDDRCWLNKKFYEISIMENFYSKTLPIIYAVMNSNRFTFQIILWGKNFLKWCQTSLMSLRARNLSSGFNWHFWWKIDFGNPKNGLGHKISEEIIRSHCSKEWKSLLCLDNHFHFSKNQSLLKAKNNLVL